MKQQVIVIHGGDSFKTRQDYLSFLRNWRIDFERYKSGKRDWKGEIGKVLGKKFEVIMPDMPNKRNAKYQEWKIWFEKFIPHLQPGVILVGHSLGGLFLAKYLSQNIFPKKIRATFLVAATYGEGGFHLPKSLIQLERQGGKIFLYHSKDDKVVPFTHLKKYEKQLKTAAVRVFKNRGHFNQDKFPELTRNIRQYLRRKRRVMIR